MLIITWNNTHNIIANIYSLNNCKMFSEYESKPRLRGYDYCNDEIDECDVLCELPYYRWACLQ
ncbi:MAG: hypothetical protein ACI9RO_002433 [Alteromonas macleodii]|jgi:hypothetical protein